MLMYHRTIYHAIPNSFAALTCELRFAYYQRSHPSLPIDSQFSFICVLPFIDCIRDISLTRICISLFHAMSLYLWLFCLHSYPNRKKTIHPNWPTPSDCGSQLPPVPVVWKRRLVSSRYSAVVAR